MLRKERVATRKPISGGEVSYEEVEERLVYDFDGDLIRLKNLYYDITTTPNHKFSLEILKRKREVTEEEIYKGFKGQTFYKLPLTGEVVGEEAKDIFNYEVNDFLFLRVVYF